MLMVSKGSLEDLYWNKWLSTREIAKIVGKSQATVRKMMLNVGVQLRSNRDWLRAKINHETLKDLYWNKKMTISQIARKLGVSGWTVHQRMIKFGIPRRRVGEANLKQQKSFFSNDPTEMVYLLGLRAGDFSARRKGKRVRVEVCTSHPAMVKLFRGLFSRYTHVGMCPEYNKRSQIFLWRAFADLDVSFSFLIEKSKSIKNDILLEEDLFLAFLAGYTDAEGSIIISPTRDQIQLIFRICSEDFGLLNCIHEKLLGMGYHPRLVLETPKGVKKGFSKLRADYWRLELSRKDEVMWLVQRLPIKHSEKKRKRNLMLEIRNQTRWVEVKDKVSSLRTEIEREVRECTREAASVYSKKHILKAQ